MLIIIQKIAYVLIIVFVNTYLCSYLGAKLPARMELRRGYRRTGMGGIGFPAIRFLSYAGRDNSVGIWSFMIFIFSLLMWAVVPFSSELLLIDMDSNLMTALLFLLITVILSITGLERTRYGIIWSTASRKTVSVINLTIPFLISIASLVLASRTFSLKTIVDLQRDHWNVVYQPFGLIIAVISVVLILKILGLNREGRRGLASIDRSGGSGLSGAVSRFSRYSIILFMTYLITLLYLGGYKSLYFIRGDVMLGLKFYILFIFILFAGKSLGSNMSDAGVFMRISGKFLIPLAIINFAVTLGFFILRNIYGLV